MVVGPSNFGFKVSNGIVFGCTLYALLLSVYVPMWSPLSSVSCGRCLATNLAVNPGHN